MVFPLEPDDPQQLGPYRLAGRLGEGGQGVVYLGFDASGERVAVKMLSRGDRETRARLGRELQALESIASFCTARVLDASVDGPTPWVVSEFVDGPSLAQRLHERGPLRGGELERLAIGTATALAAIHSAGVVHRDFKPGNVLLGPDGPRVVDFGIARAEGAATMTSGLIGTPAYLAPEQISGSPASPASDVFAWAATVVCAATGHSPFGADTVPAVMHRVLYAEPDLSALPVRLRGIIGAALSKDPAGRPTAHDLMVTLVNPNATAAPISPPVTRPSPSAGDDQRPPARPRKKRALVYATGAVVVALAAVGGAVWFTKQPGGTGATGASTPPATAEQNPGDESLGVPSLAADQPTPTPSRSRPTQARAATARVPKSFAGTWSGETTSTNVLDPAGAVHTVELKAGAPTAEWSERDSDVQCSGTLTLTTIEGDTLVFALGDIKGGCIPGTVWLTLKGDAVTYIWRDTPGWNMVEETGTLRRK
ncbi:protein kinase [Nonomuraea sp. NPDC050328]|uniref:serine/threonine-protein kinase n=1 Tax=Nonomuraea sp. NPDC050328 TaxID=3364361 RepID=UPI00379DF769